MLQLLLFPSLPPNIQISNLALKLETWKMDTDKTMNTKYFTQLLPSSHATCHKTIQGSVTCIFSNAQHFYTFTHLHGSGM